jgi:hypothetical protein
VRTLNLTLTVILAEALACLLIWSIFAPDHHITAAHSLAWGDVALVTRMVLALSASRIGLSVIGYVVDGAVAAKVANILPAVSRGIAWVEVVPEIALLNAGKRQIF